MVGIMVDPYACVVVRPEEVSVETCQYATLAAEAEEVSFAVKVGPSAEASEVASLVIMTAAIGEP